MDIFNVQDLTSEFSVMDVVLVMVLSFVLSAFIGWIYKTTHRGTSYTQSFVFTLVLNGMVVALVMMVVGSNIARAFSLVGALSIIRFRNAVRETRDVGFIFFTMAIGMAIGTRFYLLGVMSSQILCIQIPNGAPFDTLFDRVFIKYTSSSELISVDSVHSGMMTELTYSIGMKKSNQIQEFLAEIKNLNGDNKVTLIAGYNVTDL
jgi:uncharacterized membrane protein YhiD involved in acid resistance